MIHSAAIARWARLIGWLKQPDRADVHWLGKNCVVVAWLGLLLAMLSPPHGSGVMLCWFHDATGLSCPGCGLTRSISCGIRGMFSESWHYHPLGLFVLLLFLLVATQSLLPNRIRDRLAGLMQSRPALFNTLYVSFVAAFLGFGALRAFLQFAAGVMKF